MAEASKPVYLSSLQVFRGLAALGVLVYHACLFTERKTQQVLLGGLFHFGELGVDFFFVLSGFIITFIHGAELGQPQFAPRYLYRRFFRVYPLLFILTSVKLGLELVAWQRGGTPPEISRIISSYLLLPAPEGMMPVITAAWTLMHEALFYALFLIALILGYRRALLLLSLWMAAIFATHLMGAKLYDLPRLICDAHNVEFVFGIVVCACFQRRHEWRWSPVWVSIVALVFLGLGAWAYDHVKGMDQPLQVRLLLGAAFALIILATGVWEQGLKSQPWPKWACWLGDASYSIYLGHSMVLLALINAGSKLAPDSLAMRYVVAGGACLAALAACAVLWALVERPLLRWSRRWQA
ncbi:acyltransferase family protein [Brevifollis gellanilyticus]|uniref:Acyltransferase n=1 Tax=Brevifollis gellanilyticus TaxID=748831 RepID=A0A512M407_9BACT|nr:acyltransferase [Brevifollis gellanilyticus]GEP41475.1 acyltransferase [Brevifollis gellanilyticus]